MKKISEVLEKYTPKSDKYISREFQDYGYMLAAELNDLQKVPLYIKLAKTVPRERLEAARSFVKDANNVNSLPKLFLWKVKKLGEKKNFPKVE